MMQAASDELLQKENAVGTHILLRELWDYGNYEIELNWAQTYHLDGCDDCLTVLAFCHIAQSFEDLQRRVEQADVFKDHEDRD